MVLPLSTDRPLARPTLVTYALIACCVVVHLVKYALARSNQPLHDTMIDALVLNPAPGQLRWYAFFTYQFLHADFMHLLGNMLFLFVFGPAVEDRLRRWGFLLFYLVGGAFAGLAHMMLEPAVTDELGQSIVPPVMGASGAIACVTGAYLALFPLASIRVFVFFVVVGVYHFPAWMMIVAAVAKDLWSSASSARGGGEHIAFAAHLGGYVYGCVIAMLLLACKVLPREPYDLFSMGRQAHRRRVFKELASGGKTPWLADAPAKSKVAAAAATDPRVERAASLRADIARAISAGDHNRAAETYITLLDLLPDSALARDNQIVVANHLFALRRHAAAAAAYELFIKRYPSDREASQVRLMLALVNARYLNDPVRAKSLLAELNSQTCDDAQRRLAQELSAELG